MRENRVTFKPKRNDVRQNLIIGGSRNEFGTRICRKAVCEKCQQIDYVPVSRSKKTDSLFCRKCAEVEILAFEKGKKIKPEMLARKCDQCRNDFELPAWLDSQGPLLCGDCFRGFEIWSGSLKNTPHERALSVITRRPAGTVLRTRS